MGLYEFIKGSLANTALLVVVGTAIMFAVVSGPSLLGSTVDDYEPAEPETINDSETRDELLTSINAVRAERDKNNLTVQNRINTVAQRNAEQLAAAGDVNATRETATSRYEAAGCSAGSESVAMAWKNKPVKVGDMTMSAGSSEDLADLFVAVWMDSEQHKANMLGLATRFGAGVASNDDGEVYASVMYCG